MDDEYRKVEFEEIQIGDHVLWISWATPEGEVKKGEVVSIDRGLRLVTIQTVVNVGPVEVEKNFIVAFDRAEGIRKKETVHG